jgi:hypothetical protein
MAKGDRAVKARGAAPPARTLVALMALLAGAGCGSRGELLGTIAPPAPPRFDPPALVLALSDTASIDEDPTFTGDLLELYFMSTRAGGKDIWTSRRASATDPWGAPAPVPELSSPGNDWAPCVTLDGLGIWFATDRNTPNGHIWHATRANRADPWGAPAPVPELVGDDADFAPAVDATETIMFFSSNRTSSAGYDIYASTRASAADAWSAPSPVPGINSAFDEYDPFVAQGGLVVFFTSMRSGQGDIFWATRPSTREPFTAPVPLADIDSAVYDSDSTLSPDLTYMMFSSTRSGNAEIYETHATR